MSREPLIPLFYWLAHTTVGTTIRSSAVLIAITQIIHLLGLTMLIGTVLMIDMALLGFGIRQHPVSRIAAELSPWTIGGLVVMLISGPFILSSETLKCYESSFFWIKMAVLLAAIAFHFTVHRRVVRSEPPPGRFRAGLVACVSLSLWIGVAVAGKMIGIYGDDLRKDPAPFEVRLAHPKCGVDDRFSVVRGCSANGSTPATQKRWPAPGGYYDTCGRGKYLINSASLPFSL